MQYSDASVGDLSLLIRQLARMRANILRETIAFVNVHRNMYSLMTAALRVNG
jgi:hypothetical protein